MFRDINDFLIQWEEESKSTLKVFQNISDEKAKILLPNYPKSLLNLSIHIIQSLNMLESAGIPNVIPNFDKNNIDSISKVIENYNIGSNNIISCVKNWNNNDLLIEDNNYGELWKRGFTLLALICHQAHHRAQMTVLMRQLGLLVPGVYGPSKEEWSQFGMTEPED